MHIMPHTRPGGRPVSIEAIHWALNSAPDFADEDPRKRPHLAIVLLGLANHADPDGRNAFPSIDTLCRYTRLSESTVRRCLQRLVELGVIQPGDPDLQEFYIRRRDRRPAVYDLVMDGPLAPAAPVDNPASGVSYRPDGVSQQAARGVTPAGNPGPYDTRTVLEPNKNRPGRAHAHATPPCGQCDARPGDPVSARVVWLDEHRATPCPRCHPRSPAASR